jgi:hypothetical protein
MRKLIVAALFASALAVGTAHAQVYVRVSASGAGVRAPWPATSPGLGLARWISALGWPRVRLGSRQLGSAAAPSRGLGRGPLGASTTRLGLDGGPLALVRGKTLSFQ